MIHYIRRFEVNQAVNYIKSNDIYLLDKIYSKTDAQDIIEEFHEGKSLEVELQEYTKGEELRDIIKELSKKEWIRQSEKLIDDSSFSEC